MLVKTASNEQFTNAFLDTFYSTTSPAYGDGSVVQALNSGRDGGGGVTFTPNTDVTGVNYSLYIGDICPPDSQIFVGQWIHQTAAQGTLGGRLLTLVDAPEDVFGQTVQVAINIMADGKLRATRATAAGTGIILRGTDQGGDSQMTLLGTSSNALTTDCYIEIQVVFHGSTGQINVWVDNVAFWGISGLNTAISGRNQCTQFLWGGYGVTGVGVGTLHHEDLAAVITDQVVINSIVNPDDPNDPVDRIGNHKPTLLLPTADATLTNWTPDPVQAHYLNVHEIPPDSETTENTAATTALVDDFTMQAAGSSDNQVYLAYDGFVRCDSPAECTGTAVPQHFESMVLTESPALGQIRAGYIDAGTCKTTDFDCRRAQSICSLSQDMESVSFKANQFFTTFYSMFAGLTPVVNPPRIANPLGPPGYIQVTWNAFRNVIAPPTSVTYALPFYQPWLGIALSTNTHMQTSGDYFEFTVPYAGTGMYVGLCDETIGISTFSPYDPDVMGFRFSENIPGSPFFWVSDKYSYFGESTFSYVTADLFKVVRQDPDVKFYQNGVLKGTITPAVMPTTLAPFAFMGTWGWDGLTYAFPPTINNAFAFVGGFQCTQYTLTYNCSPDVPPVSSNDFAPADLMQWGVIFNDFNDSDSIIDCTVSDPGSNPSPNSPAFGINLDTVLTFSISGSTIVLSVDGWVSYADNMTTVVGDQATWVYTVPRSHTQFSLQPPFDTYNVGYPPPPSMLSFEYPFPDTTANNLPLYFGAIINNSYESPQIVSGLGFTDVKMTFVEVPNPTKFAGLMRTSVNRDGTSAEVPAIYAYRQSFLSTTPEGNPITLSDVDPAKHGYTDPE